jgi:hypothetical protein
MREKIITIKLYSRHELITALVNSGRFKCEYFKKRDEWVITYVKDPTITISLPREESPVYEYYHQVVIDYLVLLQSDEQKEGGEG